MNSNDYKISDLINNSLEYYDKKNKLNKKYIKNSKLEFNNENKEVLILNNINNDLKLKSKYEILGIFDYQTKVWVWAWMLPFLSKTETVISRELLEYGLKLDPNTNSNDHFYIKSQLLNSRFTIENKIELDIHLSLSSYLIKDLHSFIFPLKFYINKNKYIIIYYLII